MHRPGALFAMLAVLLQQTLAAEDPAAIYTDCEKDTVKGCFGAPKDCIKDKTCKMIVAFKRTDEKKHTFLVQADVTDLDYVALGFSKDGAMIESSVIACIKKSDNSLALQTSKNNGPEKKNFMDTSLAEYAKTTKNIVLENNIIYCEFTRDRSSNVTLINKDNKENTVHFDLDNGDHYLLLARGKLLSNSEQMAQHETTTSDRLQSDALKLFNYGNKKTTDDDDDDGASSLQRPAVATLFAVAMAVVARRFA